MEKLGIEALKNVIGAGFGLTERIKEITAETSSGGKKVTIPEIIGSVGEVYDIAQAVLQAKQAYEEVVDLSEEEKDELIAWAGTEFDVTNDKVEALVIQCILCVLEIAKTVELITTLKE